jgi:hypothetical protein
MRNFPQPTVPASIVPALLDDIWLHVADLVSEWQDRAALCLAHPRIGLTSIRSLKTYKDPLLAVAIALWHRSATSLLTEQRFRQYAGHSEATEEGCHWLTCASERHGVALAFEMTKTTGSSTTLVIWNLAMAIVENMKLRLRSPRVRVVHTDGKVEHLEGAENAERTVRVVHTNGNVEHYEGEKGAERTVRVVHSNGIMEHYEGEKGAERTVRLMLTNGAMVHFEGEQGAERKVRIVLTNGTVYHFEGDKDAEQMVRLVHTNGDEYHYEGEKGAERSVRVVLTNGNEYHYEGEKGAERMVRIVHTNGRAAII